MQRQKKSDVEIKRLKRLARQYREVVMGKERGSQRHIHMHTHKGEAGTESV